MSIIDFFNGKCPSQRDNTNTITNLMQGLPQVVTLQRANAEKLEKAKEMLGTSWILHKNNSIKRKEGV